LGNPKPATAANSNQAVTEQGDFPTAAQVAQGMSNFTFFQSWLAYSHAVSTSSKKAKSSEVKDATDIARSQYTQTRMEADDTFRGVHLDPNAHYWDEVTSISIS
jgi:hypothetical protein